MVTTTEPTTISTIATSASPVTVRTPADTVVPPGSTSIGSESTFVQIMT